ncbi:MAG: MarC family protein [Candidatus Ratteibacteria bacterium]|jgi:multiple antibiotic resistance protein
MSEKLIKEILLFLVIFNPVSKIVILSALGESRGRLQLRNVSLGATATAGIILLTFAVAGTFLLQNVFQIKLYSLEIVGGLVLFLIGMHALQKGEFFETDPCSNVDLHDIAIVPIGYPMIAGPASITACITRTSMIGVSLTSIAIIAALGINLIIMLCSVHVGSLLRRYGLMGPFVRITGLLVASIGVNMALNGFGAFMGR